MRIRVYTFQCRIFQNTFNISHPIASSCVYSQGSNSDCNANIIEHLNKPVVSFPSPLSLSLAHSLVHSLSFFQFDCIRKVFILMLCFCAFHRTKEIIWNRPEYFELQHVGACFHVRFTTFRIYHRYIHVNWIVHCAVSTKKNWGKKYIDVIYIIIQQYYDDNYCHWLTTSFWCNFF